MSRGAGQLQRWLLENLPVVYDNRFVGETDYRDARYYDDGALTIDLAAAYYDTMWVTDGQMSAVRRALRGLEKKSLVHRWGTGRTHTWTLTPRPVTCVRGVTRQFYRETDRCDSCARLFTDVRIATPYQWTGKDDGTYKVRGLALCPDCDNGCIDPIGLASNGEYTIDRMPPIPCGQCGGELSEHGLRRVYVSGVLLPLCDTCKSESSRKSADRAMERAGYPPNWRDLIPGLE